MPKTRAAIELAKKVADGGGKKGAELVKKGSKHKAVDTAKERAVKKVADSAADQIAGVLLGVVTGGGGAAFARNKAKRDNRRLARDLARQIGGTYSLDVVVGLERRHVVWAHDDTPYRALPDLPDGTGPLEDLPDLIHFRGPRHKPKPQTP